VLQHSFNFRETNVCKQCKAWNSGWIRDLGDVAVWSRRRSQSEHHVVSQYRTGWDYSW